RGGVGADAERGDDDHGRGEPGRAPEGTERVAQVLPERVPVRARRGGDGVGEGREPETEHGGAPGLAPALDEDPLHLVAVVDAERARVEVEERTVEARRAGLSHTVNIVDV